MKNTDLVTRYFLSAHDASLNYAKARLIHRAVAKHATPHEVAVFQLDGMQLCRVVLAGQVFYGEVTEVDDYLKAMTDANQSIDVALREASEQFNEAQRWPDAVDEYVAKLLLIAQHSMDRITATQSTQHFAARDAFNAEGV